MATAPDRDKALATVMGQIEKQHGKGAVMRLGDDVRPPIEVIPTGSIALDVALGIGGLPRGRVVEIYGPESSGKTTVALHAVANAQRAGGIAAFIDAEHALDVGYARRLGVKVDDLLVSQPDTGEQALEIADVLLRSGAIDFALDAATRRCVAQRPRSSLRANDRPGALQRRPQRGGSPWDRRRCRVVDLHVADARAPAVRRRQQVSLDRRQHRRTVPLQDPRDRSSGLA